VFEGSIDRIVGVAMSRDLLDFISDPSALETVTVSNGFQRFPLRPVTVSVCMLMPVSSLQVQQQHCVV
jgi:hypothetical protein